MRRARERQSIELFLVALSMFAVVLTVVWSDWIELLFRVDPDQGNGSLEWLIVAISGLNTIAFSILVGKGLRRSHATAAEISAR
jgi:hypothetical protein